MNSDCEGVFVVAGGGINLLTWLLENPGEHTSTAVLEATVPDSRAALEEYVEHYAQYSLEGQEIVSEEVCNSMALAAYDRAHWLSSKLANVFGLAISASLVTNYEKHEEIHAYISMVIDGGEFQICHIQSDVLEGLNRQQQDRHVSLIAYRLMNKIFGGRKG